MRILDIITESKQIDEAPMGMLSTLGNKIASKFGSTTAGGKLKSGASANKLFKDFQDYLGQTGDEANAEAVLAFLKSRGYPTTAAEKVIASEVPPEQPTTPATTAPAEPAAAPASSNTPAQNAPVSTKTSTNPINKNPVKNPSDVKAPATTAPAEPAAAPVNYDEPTWKRKGMSAPTMQPAQPAAPAAQPVDYDVPAWQRKGMSAPQTTPVTPKARGGKVAGQVSQTPNAVRKRNARAAAKSRLSEEALPAATLNKMFLAAAQEAAKMKLLKPQAAQSTQAAPDTGSGEDDAAQAPASTHPSGFVAGFRQGMSGGNLPNTPSSNAPLSARMSLKDVQKAAMQLDPTDQQKLLAFLQRKVGTS